MILRWKPGVRRKHAPDTGRVESVDTFGYAEAVLARVAVFAVAAEATRWVITAFVVVTCRDIRRALVHVWNAEQNTTRRRLSRAQVHAYNAEQNTTRWHPLFRQSPYTMSQGNRKIQFSISEVPRAKCKKSIGKVAPSHLAGDNYTI